MLKLLPHDGIEGSYYLMTALKAQRNTPPYGRKVRRNEVMPSAPLEDLTAHLVPDAGHIFSVA